MNITNELLAAYVENNVTPEEREVVRQYLASNPKAFQSVCFAMNSDYILPEKDEYLNTLDWILNDVNSSNHNLSLESMASTIAAQNPSDNLCVIRCESIALRHFGYKISDEELIEESKRQGWLQTNGTLFTDIGKLSKRYGLTVSQTNGNLEKLQKALSNDSIIIAFIDEGELTGNYNQERYEDQFIGGCPDHVVIVKSIAEKSVTIIDSYTPDQTDTYPIDQFLDAWNDSDNFMVVINS